ncbi:hypothetical protein OQA88_11498 [Cercophora sp. LCS_1]
MRILTATSLVACFALRATAWNHVSEEVLQEKLDSAGYTLVAFVSPSDPKSAALEAEWTAIQEAKNDENIVSFDCGAHPEKCTELEVKAVPAVRVYHRDGRVNRYRGGLNRRDIPPFLYRTLRPPVLEVDPYAYDPLTTIDNVVVIGHIHPQDYELYDLFYDLAAQYREDYGFVIVPPEEGATGSFVRCWNNVEGGKWVTYGRNLGAFVRWCGGLVHGDESEGGTVEGKKVVRFTTESEREKEEFRKEVTGLARRLSGSVRFVVAEGARGLTVEGDEGVRRERVEGAPKREFVEGLLGVGETLWSEEDEKDGFRIWKDHAQLAAQEVKDANGAQEVKEKKEEEEEEKKKDGLWKDDAEKIVHEEL